MGREPVTTAGTSPGWYPDTDVPGGMRYWDGSAWTVHRTPPAGPAYPVYGPPGYGPPMHRPPPGYGPPPGGSWLPGPYGPPMAWGKSPWKGADLGRPATGPGALAEPGRRLGGRMIDLALMVPVFAVLLTATLLIAAPHFGPWFPPTVQNANGTTQSIPMPGFVWFYLAVFGCSLATGLVLLAYETVAVAKYGRTVGMGVLGLRPVRFDGSPLGWSRSLVRALIFWLFGFLSWLGLLDPLWCLWDEHRQCLHDKVAGSIMINALVESPAPVPDADGGEGPGTNPWAPVSSTT